MDEIKRMLDTKDDANVEIMSECARDIEALLNDEDIEPNEIATNAYKQKMVDYLRDQQENISLEQANRIFKYIDSLSEIIARNMNVQMNNQLADEGLPSVQGTQAGMVGQAAVPGQPEPVMPPLPELPVNQ